LLAQSKTNKDLGVADDETALKEPNWHSCLKERNAKRNHLHFAGGSKCRWNDQMQEVTVIDCFLFCQQLEMQMTVSHNPHFPAAFCDSSRMQICY